MLNFAKGNTNGALPTGNTHYNFDSLDTSYTFKTLTANNRDATTATLLEGTLNFNASGILVNPINTAANKTTTIHVGKNRNTVNAIFNSAVNGEGTNDVDFSIFKVFLMQALQLPLLQAQEKLTLQIQEVIIEKKEPLL